MEKSSSIAIIGSGIAGMACAYHLRNEYDIVLYEKNNYIGGHTNPVIVDEEGRPIPIDTGFMVYNDRTYPNLIRLFGELGIESLDTSMSFGLQDLKSGLETRFENLASFFAQRINLLKPRCWSALLGIRHFFAAANRFLEKEGSPDATLREFLLSEKCNPLTERYFVLPMTAAIWSTPPGKMLDYPALSLFQFLKNHGLLGLGEQFQWKTIKGSSKQYRDRILNAIGDQARVSRGITSLTRIPEGVKVTDDDGTSTLHEKAIVATHADQALALLEAPTPEESQLLGAFKYNHSPACLHSDASVMPKQKRAWASWNFCYDAESNSSSTHYWMNNLQNCSSKRNYFVSIGYQGEIDSKLMHWSGEYEHPRYDYKAINAQKKLPYLNAKGPVYYCGSYFKHGFHEDAYTSALNVVEAIRKKKAFAA